VVFRPSAINNVWKGTDSSRRAFIYNNGMMKYLATLSGTVGESFAVDIGGGEGNAY